MDTKEISETSKNVVVRGEGRETSRKMLCREKRVAKTEKRPQLLKKKLPSIVFFLLQLIIVYICLTLSFYLPVVW